ncbi:unnamed protein product [Pseudo-nitzschia multistriata]|uniref:Nucleosome assembly protein n=1 Tax=Pseudo-nitzschia multistriata TaxID=183589 RepID=A0A448ZGM5_9STRA|nr:unnamed protein product [Pseudo-nitzschia multistriata]
MTSEDETAATMTTEEKIQAEIEKAKGMKISEMKMKLMAKGVLTSHFVEKDEFVRAYAEAVVKSSESGLSSGLTGFKNNDGAVEEVEDDGVEGITEGLPHYIQLRVEKLKEINNERDALMKEYLAERAAMEAKFQKLSEPLYERRKEVVLGQMDDEIAAAGETKEADGEEMDKGIPMFWACAIQQMPVTQGIVSEEDIECLGHLEDIKCINDDNGEGFSLEFHFAPNDYFENTVLTKSYDVPNLLLADEPILKNVEGCEIKWKPNIALTHVEVTKQQRGTGKNAGQVRTVTKKVPRDSFFNFFTAPSMPNLETMDEEECLRVEAAFDEDYDIAQAFRSHIIPKAIEWFAGDAMEKELEAAMEGMELKE